MFCASIVRVKDRIYLIGFLKKLLWKTVVGSNAGHKRPSLKKVGRELRFRIYSGRKSLSSVVTTGSRSIRMWARQSKNLIIHATPPHPNASGCAALMSNFESTHLKYPWMQKWPSQQEEAYHPRFAHILVDQTCSRPLGRSNDAILVPHLFFLKRWPVVPSRSTRLVHQPRPSIYPDANGNLCPSVMLQKNCTLIRVRCIDVVQDKCKCMPFASH
jgi:hypothetical protein